SGFFADWIYRIMPNKYRSHRIGKRHLWREVKWILEHDFLETLTAMRQEHVAHHYDSEEFLLVVCDKAVRDDCFLGEPPNLFGCFGDCRLWTENSQRRGSLSAAAPPPVPLCLLS